MTPQTSSGWRPAGLGTHRLGLGRVVRRTLLILAAPLLAVACSLPVDERVTRLEDDEIPPEIGETTTTTTTTTTTLPPTTMPAPTSTIDGVPAPTTTTTTTPQIATAPVRVFYTLRFTTQLVPVQLDLPAPAQIAFIVDRLENTSDLDAGLNLRSSVRAGLIEVERIVVERGTATIPLNAAELNRMSDAAIDRAIAQIVLTFTSFPTLPDQGNIGLVVFEVDGQGFPVFVPAGGGSSEPGEPLAFSDFAQLILSTPSPTTTTTRPPPPPPPVTTTTTAVSETTVPPDGTAPPTSATTTTSSTTTTTVADDQ